MYVCHLTLELRTDTAIKSLLEPSSRYVLITANFGVAQFSVPMFSANMMDSHGTENGSKSTPSRVNMTACIRCRQKKKRCDQRLPKCRLCELAGVECVGYDAIARKQVARSYVQSLEQRVAYLESKLQEAGDCSLDAVANLESTMAQTQPRTSFEERVTPSLPEIDMNLSLRAKSTANDVLSLIQPVPQSEHSFSNLLLAELMRAKVSLQPGMPAAIHESAANTSSSALVEKLYSGPVSLPEKDSAEGLVRAYFQHMNLGMPLLHEPTFRTKLDLLYTMPLNINMDETHTSREARIALFFVFEAFAVAILSLQKQDPTAIPTWLADRYHHTAIMALDKIGIPTSVEGVQVLLLISQYLYHHPTVWSAWKTVGAACRLAVELGLHQDCVPNPNFLTLDTMRRTFWVAYAMDRNTSMNLGRPVCLSDGAISAKFPSAIDDRFITSDGISTDDASKSWSKCISIHLFRYRQMQSEMRVVLYEKAPPYGLIDMDQWQQGMRERIEEWYRSPPTDENFNNSEKGVIDTFEVTYNTALFHLYRPSGNIPSPSGSQLVCMVKAAVNMIQLYRRFFREKKLTIYWQSVENLSSAGTALMFSYVKSEDVRNFLTFHNLQSLVHSCSSVLWGMVERFPAFQGKRDAFDMTASQVLADLSTDPSITGSQLPVAQSSANPGGTDVSPSGIEETPSLQGRGGESLLGREMQVDQSPPLNWPSTANPSNSGEDAAMTSQSLFSLDDLGNLDFIWDFAAKDNGAYSMMWME